MQARVETLRVRPEKKREESKRQNEPQARLSSELVVLRDAERKIRAANFGQQLSDNVSHRVLLAAVVMQLDHLEQKQKEGKKSLCKQAPPRIHERVCQLLGVGPNTFSKSIHTCFGATSEVAAVSAFYRADSRKGNNSKKATWILTQPKFTSPRATLCGPNG